MSAPASRLLANVASDTVPHPDGYRPAWLLRLPYPLRNVLRRWRGTLGILGGVGLALGIVITLSGTGRGMIQGYTADFRDSGADLYVVTDGGKLVQFLPSDQPGTIARGPGKLRQVRGWPEVREAVGFMTWALVRTREGPRRYDQPSELITVVGLDGDPSAIPGAVVLAEGRWLRRPDDVVLGSKLAREKGLAVGSTVRLAGRDLDVVGIGKVRGVGFAANTLAYLDYRTLQQQAGLGDVLNAFIVETGHPEVVRGRLDELESVTVLSPDDLVQQAKQAAETESVMYTIFNSLALAVAALFVSSMLSRSVAQRRTEFGTLRALGIPGRTILLSVGVEAVFVCAAAWVVGVGSALVLGEWFLNGYVAAEYNIEFLFAPDAGTYLQTFALALGLGVVAGLLPAREATHVDPIDVLREA